MDVTLKSLVVLFTAAGTALEAALAVAQTSTVQPDAAVALNNPIESLPPIARAVVDGNMPAIIALLEKQPETVNEKVPAKKGERAGYTPLILAAALSHPEIAKYLIMHRADLTELDDFNRSAIWYAAFNGDIEVTQVLISTYEKSTVNKVINVADVDFVRTPLQLAVRRNEPEVVHDLLVAGASEESKDASGETPVDFCKRNHTSACKELLK